MSELSRSGSRRSLREEGIRQKPTTERTSRLLFQVANQIQRAHESMIKPLLRLPPQFIQNHVLGVRYYIYPCGTCALGSDGGVYGFYIPPGVQVGGYSQVLEKYPRLLISPNQGRTDFFCGPKLTYVMPAVDPEEIRIESMVQETQLKIAADIYAGKVSQKKLGWWTRFIEWFFDYCSFLLPETAKGNVSPKEVESSSTVSYPRVMPHAELNSWGGNPLRLLIALTEDDELVVDWSEVEDEDAESFAVRVRPLLYSAEQLFRFTSSTIPDILFSAADTYRHTQVELDDGVHEQSTHLRVSERVESIPRVRQ